MNTGRQIDWSHLKVHQIKQLPTNYRSRARSSHTSKRKTFLSLRLRWSSGIHSKCGFWMNIRTFSAFAFWLKNEQQKLNSQTVQQSSTRSISRYASGKRRQKLGRNLFFYLDPGRFFNNSISKSIAETRKREKLWKEKWTNRNFLCEQKSHCEAQTKTLRIRHREWD